MTARPHFLSRQELREEDSLILFYQSQVLAKADNFLWNISLLPEDIFEQADFLLLEESGKAVVAVHCWTDISELVEAELKPLRSLLFSENEAGFNLAGKASQLLNWYRSHKYCGACGKETAHHHSERALVCESCNNHYYPRINPCVIMLVVKGKQMLLARSARFKSGFSSCLAGFMEIGETPEETLVREVREEVGLEVENIRYIKSQSWPFPSQLMLGFLAEYKSGEIVLQADEIEEAHWYEADELPPVPSANISVAGELIEYFVSRVKSGEL